MVLLHQIVPEEERLHVLHIDSNGRFARREVSVELQAILHDSVAVEREDRRHFPSRVISHGRADGAGNLAVRDVVLGVAICRMKD